VCGPQITNTTVVTGQNALNWRDGMNTAKKHHTQKNACHTLRFETATPMGNKSVVR